MPRKTSSAARAPHDGAPAKTTAKAFVLSLPRTTPAKDLIERGKALGLELTPRSIFAIRSALPMPSTLREMPAPPSVSAPPPASPAEKPDPAKAKAFQRMATELGLDRARAIVLAIERETAAARA